MLAPLRPPHALRIVVVAAAFVANSARAFAVETNAGGGGAAWKSPEVAATFTPDPASVVRFGPAYKYPQHGWLVVHVEGQPYERGYQQGRLLAEEIVEYQKTLAAHRSAKDPAGGWRDLRLLTDALVLRTYQREYLEEMQGIADGASSAGARIDGRRFELSDVAALNSFIELEFLPRALEATPTGLEGLKFRTPEVEAAAAETEDHCSAFAANGRATRRGDVVFGHITMFSLPVVRHFNVWLDVRPTEGFRVVLQGYPGAIQSGLDYYLNSAGILLTETTLAQTTFNGRGSSVASRIREAAQYADSIEAAVERLAAAGNGLYTNEWILADVKTGETAMFELGTNSKKLWRSARDEWPADTAGFYWGCNNAKDQALRLETLAGTNDRPADVLFAPRPRDRAWLQLFDAHRGRIDPEFGFRSFGTSPIVGYQSCDAKFTTSSAARKLESWALFGPPLGRVWMPKRSDVERYADVKPLVPNDWTYLTTAPPPASAADVATAAAVDLAPFRKDESVPHVTASGRLPPVWRGTLLPAADADVWLSVAFAEYEKLVAWEHALRFEAKGKPLGRRAAQLLDTALFAKRSAWQTAVRRAGADVPLAALRRTWTDDHWHRIAAGKGTLLLAELRHAVGAEKFDRLMDDFGRAHAGRPTSTAEFVAHFRAAGVSDVERRMAPWLSGEVEASYAVGNPWAVDSFEDDLPAVVIVYGTTADREANRDAAEQLQRNIAARSGNFRVDALPDHAADDALLGSRHVVLVGRPAANRLTQRWSKQFAVGFGSASFSLPGEDGKRETYAHPASAVLAAGENPLSRRHSVVVYAGLSADSTWHAVQAFPDCGGRGAEAIVLAHGAKPRPIALTQPVARTQPIVPTKPNAPSP